MVRITWTEQALDDVENIVNFISRDSVHYARMHAQKIFGAVKRLEHFPESGRVVPEIGKKEIREILLGNYRIIYRLKQNAVEILTVYHSARLLSSVDITGGGTS